MLALGMFVLGRLKHVEKRWKQDRRATFSWVVDKSGPTEDESDKNC
jgi:hypothetical protein